MRHATFPSPAGETGGLLLMSATSNDDRSAVPTPGRRTIVVGAFALAGLNAAFAVFFITWWLADSAAINSTESAVGYDATVMLPHANLMWVAAMASLILLIAVDIFAVLVFRGIRSH